MIPTTSILLYFFCGRFGDFQECTILDVAQPVKTRQENAITSHFAFIAEYFDERYKEPDRNPARFLFQYPTKNRNKNNIPFQEII
jgi:hypothetical protein